MKKIERSTIILMMFVVLFLVLYMRSNTALNEARETNATLNTKLLTQKEQYVATTDQLNKSIVALQDQIKSLSLDHNALIQKYEALSQKLPVIDEFELSLLEEKGINDPNLIIEDLYTHPELIPYEGILGGTLFFYSAYIISDQWVIARFEDGHFNGCALYEFGIDEDQNISWHLLKDRLY